MTITEDGRFAVVVIAQEDPLGRRTLNEAVRIGAGIPLAKLGSIEVRPVVDYSKPRPKL